MKLLCKYAAFYVGSLVELIVFFMFSYYDNLEYLVSINFFFKVKGYFVPVKSMIMFAKVKKLNS